MLISIYLIDLNYNNTAFEIKTNDLNAQDTICGGGRYNGLAQQLGGPATPAMGWAIGVERLMLLLQNQVKHMENLVDFYIITTNCVADNYALSIGEIRY